MKRYYGSEAEAFLIAESFLRLLCENNWRSLEFDEKYSEICLLFIYAWRQLPTNTGHFLQDFEAVCRPHMDSLNRKAYARRFKHQSIDASIFREKGNNRNEFSLYSILSVKDDSTELQVDEFINSLSENDREVLKALLNGESKTSVARGFGLSINQLTSKLKALGKQYLSKYCS